MLEEEEMCECQCGCDEIATTTDDAGIPVCDGCSQYWTDWSDGTVHCSSEDPEPTCPHCKQEVEFGHINTGNPGSGTSNYCLGTCDCPNREWRWDENGSWNHWSIYYDDDSEEEKDN